MNDPVFTTDSSLAIEFSISPNPVVDWVVIDIPDNNSVHTMIVYNALGQKIEEVEILDNPKIKIYLDSYQNGTYYVSILGNEVVSTQSFVKLE